MLGTQASHSATSEGSEDPRPQHHDAGAHVDLVLPESIISYEAGAVEHWKNDIGASTVHPIAASIHSFHSSGHELLDIHIFTPWLREARHLTTEGLSWSSALLLRQALGATRQQSPVCSTAFTEIPQEDLRPELLALESNYSRSLRPQEL